MVVVQEEIAALSMNYAYQFLLNFLLFGMFLFIKNFMKFVLIHSLSAVVILQGSHLSHTLEVIKNDWGFIEVTFISL